MIEFNDPNLSFVSMEEATTPHERDMVMLNRWWSVCPERGLMFWKRYSPQCNKSELISRKIGEMYPWAETVLVPVVFVPARHQTPPERY